MTPPAFFRRSDLTASLWAFRREFWLVGAFSAISNILMLMPTIYMLQVYERVLVSNSEFTLLAISLITVFLYGVIALSEWTRSRVLVYAGLRLDEQLGTRVFNASFEAYLGSSSTTPTRAFADLLQVRQFLTGQGVFAFFDAPWIPVYLGVTFLLHPLLGLLAVLFALVQIALVVFGHRRTVAPAEAASKAGSEEAFYLHGKLRNAEVLESMGMVQNLRLRWLEWHRKTIDKNTEAHGVSNRVTTFSKFIRHSQQSLTLGAGALLVIEGKLTAGGMIAGNLLVGRTLGPIDVIVNGWRGFIITRSAFRRLENLLQEFPERDTALTRVPPTGKVEVRDLVATAPGRKEPILKSISFAINAGTVVVVLGPSGSGKSTLARSLVGIWPGRSGEVLLDGLPIEGWSRLELGPHLGYLPQDIELFDGTIADNIARFAEVDSEKVIDAARCAGLHDMILRFPKGYDTSIGEAGGMLSGGQRQRIGLARAIFNDPAVVVLDEPNANLDDAGEVALMNTVAQLKAKGKTVFLITHRAGAVSAADWLLLLNDGQLVASGPRNAVITAIQDQQRAALAQTQTPLSPQAGPEPA